MRIVKEAEERRNEILDAAELLFTTKGYGKTTIVDILNKVGIAKGTFYYYFKSKEEVMEAIIERVVDNDVAIAREIASDNTLTPVEKIFKILKGQQPQDDDNKEQLIEQFHSPSNAEMHQKSISQSVRSLAPILSDVVRQGISEGIFHTEYPTEVMEFLILSGQNLFDPSMFQWSMDEIMVKVDAFISIMETLLGAEKGSFSCMHEILTGTDGEDNEK